MPNQNYKETWQYVMNKIKEEFIAQNNEVDFTIWFNNIKYVEDTVDTITVSVPSPFILQMNKTRGYFDKIQNTFRETLGMDNITLKPIIASKASSKDSDASNSGDSKNENKLSPNYNKDIKNSHFDISEIEKESDDFSENTADNLMKNQTENQLDDGKSSDSDSENNGANDNENDVNDKNNGEKTNNSKITFVKHPLLDENFTFDTFIPGENSNFAYNASLAVAKDPGKKYNPILLYGGSGLGKTHLMQAIGNYINNQNPGKLKICYVPAESFTNEFIRSTREKNTESFKNKYRKLDVLLLDDIHFLEGKEATQEELFYTFNALHEKRAQMVFTCDLPIKDVKNLKPRLVSRLSNGLCIDIKTPNYETRCAILQKKCEQKGQDIDPEVISYIAKNVETNVRELEAALTNIIAYAEIVDQKPNLEMAKNILKDVFSANPNDNISLDTIQKVIADNYGITVAELKNKKRDKKYSLPRQISFYIAREITESSYTELAQEFGKDHTTIMHGYNSIAEKIKIDPTLDSRIKSFIREIKEYKNK